MKLKAILFLLVLIAPAILWASEPMKFVYYDKYPPRSWKEGGKMKGIIIDMVNEIAKRMQLNIEHAGYPWKRAQSLVQNGMADAFVTVPTTSRKAYTIIGKVPVLKFELFAATQPDNKQLEKIKKGRKLKDFLPFSIVDYYGNGWAEKALKDFKVQWVPDVSMVYPFLAQGKADVLFVSDRGIYDMKKLGYADKLFVVPQSVYVLNFNLCVGKNSKYLWVIDQFDKHLDDMWKDGTIQKINEYYY